MAADGVGNAICLRAVGRLVQRLPPEDFHAEKGPAKKDDCFAGWHCPHGIAQTLMQQREFLARVKIPKHLL